MFRPLKFERITNPLSCHMIELIACRILLFSNWIRFPLKHFCLFKLLLFMIRLKFRMRHKHRIEYTKTAAHVASMVGSARARILRLLWVNYIWVISSSFISFSYRAKALILLRHFLDETLNRLLFVWRVTFVSIYNLGHDTVQFSIAFFFIVSYFLVER